MSKLTKTNQSGFTIIEVVLALAIGAMIIGMVFIALPNLQKQRRDTARRNDLGRFMGQLEAYAGNNNGKYPLTQGELDTFVTSYVQKDAVFEDPSTGTYLTTAAFRTVADANTTVAVGSMSYVLGARCNGEIVEANAGNRNIAAKIPLERGAACLANQ